MMWLCNNLRPKYHTIADLRKRHATQIRAEFRQFVALVCQWKQVGKKTIVIDGARFRVQNSRKANYSEEKIRRQMAYIDQKVSDYLEEMQAIDRKEKTKVKDIQRLLKLTQDKEAMERSTGNRPEMLLSFLIPARHIA